MPDIDVADLAAAQSAVLVAATTYYLSFNTADPGNTGASEGASLTRQAITFGTPTSASPSVQASTDAQSFASMPGGATYTYFSVWDAATAGNYKRGGALTPSGGITPAAGSTVTVAIGAITFDAS